MLVRTDAGARRPVLPLRASSTQTGLHDPDVPFQRTVFNNALLRYIPARLPTPIPKPAVRRS